MGKVSDLTPRKRAKIEILIKEGYCGTVIANKVGVSTASVSRLRKKLNFGQSLDVKRAGKCGRKRKSTERDDSFIVRESLKDRIKTATQIWVDVKTRDIDISKETVRRRLREAGLNAHRPLLKQKLTPAMTKKRYAWAKTLRNWTEEDWKRVVFSDESIIQCKSAGSRYVRRRVGEQFHPDCVTQRVKHPTQVMVWSVISFYGTGRLYIVEGTMKQEQYRKVIENRLLPQLRDWALKKGQQGTGDFIFMHDGAPCHKAKAVTEYLRVNDVQVLEWPGNSPDMNPIENIWGILKAEMSKKTITTRTQLVEELIAVWVRDEKFSSKCEALVQSMPARIQALLKAKGSFTKY